MDKRLSGWSASLLNKAGRVVLINSVVDSQVTYAMSAFLLPPGVLAALDRRRRRFLWSGDETVSGAQCLVAWETACQPKEQGGIGLKDLSLQNKSLQLKNLHRLHHPANSSWANWARARISAVNLQGEVEGAHWRALQDLLPLYRALTCSAVADGASTSFWFDRWLPEGRLCEMFPLLFSHPVHTELSVQQMLTDGLDMHLVLCLTRRAGEELHLLTAILNRVQLRDGQDQRLSDAIDEACHLRSKAVYTRPSTVQYSSASSLWCSIIVVVLST